MSAAENPLPRAVPAPRSEDSRGLVLKHAANELVFAVVGHVGSGTSEIAEALKDSLSNPTLPGGAFATQILKASNVIKQWHVKGPWRPLIGQPVCSTRVNYRISATKCGMKKLRAVTPIIPPLHVS